jgi:hypothetical protein
VNNRHMDYWLETEGAKWNLPGTVKEFETEWRKWLDNKLAEMKGKKK